MWKLKENCVLRTHDDNNVVVFEHTCTHTSLEQRQQH